MKSALRWMSAALVATGCIRSMERPCIRGRENRRHGVGNGAGRVARYSGKEHDRAAAERSGGAENRLHRARRRHRFHPGRQERPQAHQRRSRGRTDRLDRRAELAGHDRRRRRKHHADDLHGRRGEHRRTDGCEARVGLQDAAKRHSDGHRDRAAHGESRREDGRLHRLLPMPTARAGSRNSARPPISRRSRSSRTNASRATTLRSPARC